MKYLLYIILLYLFLPFNHYLDFIAVLTFFIAFKEDERFALIFAFAAGILIDLYYPVALGLNGLLYVILIQAVLYIKKFIAQNNVVVVTLFTAFYLIKITMTYLAVSFPVSTKQIIITLLFCVPLFLLLNRIIYRTWKKI